MDKPHVHLGVSCQLGGFVERAAHQLLRGNMGLAGEGELNNSLAIAGSEAT